MKGQFPWIGRSRGSAGGMTTAKINDKNVMRAKAFEVTNPKTAAQIMQRNFFKEVQDVCSSVTEDQLRSLFGVKPKNMTRRNALSKQIASAYTIEDGVKSVDFSKLLAIGNGEKVNTPLLSIVNGNIEDDSVTLEMFGANAKNTTNIIVVYFDSENNKIVINNIEAIIEEIIEDGIAASITSSGIQNGYFYLTCATSGENVFGQSFGSFIIKTRATD